MHFSGGKFGAGDVRRLTRMNRKCRATRGHFGLTAAHGDHSLLPIRICSNAVSTGPQQCNRAVGRIHLVGIVFTEIVDRNIQRAFRKAHLRHLIIQPQKGKRGA